MLWIHCNQCGVTPSAERHLLCGSCGHVLCSKCNELKVCPIDKHPFNGIKVNNSMPEKLRSYFDDPGKMLASWQKCIRFQFEQRTLCEQHEYVRQLKHLRQLKREVSLLNKTKAVLAESIEKDLKRNEKMKMYLRQCVQQQLEYEESSELSWTSTGGSNFSSILMESGVDLQFDEINSSR